MKRFNFNTILTLIVAAILVALLTRTIISYFVDDDAMFLYAILDVMGIAVLAGRLLISHNVGGLWGK
jgi:hypothetical protein